MPCAWQAEAGDITDKSNHRLTLLQYLKVGLEDLEIHVDKAYKFGTIHELKKIDEKVLNAIKADLTSYIIVSKEEKNNMMVHLLLGLPTEYKLLLKDGREISISQLHFMRAEFISQKNPPIYQFVILAPQEWLKTIPIDKR